MRVPLSAERWKALEPLIDAAVELAPDRRRAFVRESSGGDAALEAELEQLLAEYDRIDEQFEVAAVERFPSLIDDSSILNAVLNERYRIERELGRGGMATVYLARDLRHDREVAVKVLHPDLAAALGAQRFLAEIKTTARLQHPHILALHDSGEADGYLFYVMPYVEGQSLRTRLERERQLPIDEVVRIANEVASALDAAHRAGVIHRDIKPENILLHNGSALVADFGIAIAASDAAPRITKSGLALGTPQYMSPEQGTGSGRVDARTDVYALGTMVFEMLAGEAPFTGATSSAILAKRAAMAAPPVKVLRASVSAEMDAVVAKALSREAVDRYGTAGEFAEGLRGAGVAGAAVDPNAKPASREAPIASAAHPYRWLVASAVAGLAVLLGATLVIARRDADSAHPSQFTLALQRVALVPRALDTSIYVVVADTGADYRNDSKRLADAVRTNLSRWNEVTLADVPSDGRGNTYGAEAEERAHQIASSVKAGRYVRTRVTRFLDSLDLSAALFATRGNERLSDARVRLASTQSDIASLVETLVDNLLFNDARPSIVRAEGSGRTRSLEARRAFLKGQVALEGGEFARADSQFVSAVRRDPQYAQALVWLAEVRSWTASADQPWVQLTQQAAQAIAQRGQLAPVDSTLLEALRASAEGRAAEACSMRLRLTDVDRYDFALWYGRGNCLRRDTVVVEDARSPSKWRFRSSYEAAVRSYEESFRLEPSVLRAFSGRSLSELETMLFTGSRLRRPGRPLGSSATHFIGIPVWAHDSLLFVPVPQTEENGPLPAGFVDAIQHERERFRAIARIWRVQYPQSADAAVAVAAALDMLGNDASLDTLRFARALATNPAERTRIAANEVFLRTKFALPLRPAELERARVLADSLLHAPSSTGTQDFHVLESLAELTGKAQLAASFAVAGAANDAPPPIAHSGPALLAYAALGGPRDSIEALEPVVESGILDLPQARRADARNQWLYRAAALAFPDYRSPFLDAARRTGAPHARLSGAAAARDSIAVRAILNVFAQARLATRPTDVAMDGLFTEAMSLYEIGDSRTAIDWLDRPLQNARLLSVQDLLGPYRDGPFVRAMVLRAELAKESGDLQTARLWARAVVALWSASDPFLQSTVAKMRELAR